MLYATDEFFAPKENLLKPAKPVYLEGKYTGVGKWMDGWESRRKREPGHDWCVIQLGLAGRLRGFLVDTAHFKGNYPAHCSIEAATVDGSPGLEGLQQPEWREALHQSPLEGDTENRFESAPGPRATHLRFHIYPDGGVARLRAYGEVMPDWPRILGRGGEIDLAAVEHGGVVIESSDMFFGSRQNLILPGPGRDMSDGWETRRRRGPGHDHAVIHLGIAGAIRRVEVDTSHFKGNYPESCSLESAGGEILPRTKLEADRRHMFEPEVRDVGPVSEVRFHIYPDGGVSRLRLYGIPAPWPAEHDLLACCGSTGWARAMLGVPRDELIETADRVWSSLGPEDWREAFRQHPEIGERRDDGWSAAEQAGARDAAPDILAALAQANRAYREKFGYIFIVCATGKTAGEMLAMAGDRLRNDPAAELRISAEEQRKITLLRLEKLLGAS